jgi:hypothetical protein
MGMPAQLRTQIVKEGQPYVDEPVYVHPRYADYTVIRQSVAQAFGRQERVPQPILVRYETVPLKWVKP